MSSYGRWGYGRWGYGRWGYGRGRRGRRGCECWRVPCVRARTTFFSGFRNRVWVSDSGFGFQVLNFDGRFGDGFRGVCVRARACVAVRARVPAGEPVGTSSYRKLLVALGGAISGRGKFWARTFLPEIAGGAGKHVCGTSSYRKLLVALGNMST